ncbi:hypothetical protein CAP40_03895 [Sphingomonas sp. IBVSS2]|uniref:hypothetical protein n=1 Tax=Sphingomonas sp. IBVSS2 TaxID=1985172 RepID=UPI000A2E8FB7|nr:hypothetical protein [Sphingomonas sp. IBVSS2]OSZ69984.1 hypothetical protein CAP40_03895 [Sphingomonas sp. IBVSS2]
MRRAAALLLPALVLAGCGGNEVRKPAAAPTPTPGARPEPAADPAARLAAAVKAAWPDGVKQGPITFDDNKLVDTGFGPVLVSHGHVRDAAHADGGTIAVHYLDADGAGFRVRQSFPKAAESGSFGDLAEWSVSDKFLDRPVIYLEGGGTWQGYTCSVTTLVELRPEGPAEIASFPSLYDDGGAVEDKPQSIRGRIADIRKGQGFTVKFEGTRSFAERYSWRGDRYQREGGESRIPTC